jgi:hypothetical protein
MIYHIEYDYATARMIHEQRIREAEHARIAAAIRSAERALRSAADCVECLTRLPATARPAA